MQRVSKSVGRAFLDVMGVLKRDFHETDPLDDKDAPMDEILESGPAGTSPSVLDAATRAALRVVEAHNEARELDVSAIRKRMGLSQAEFARRFGFAVATLRHWEIGDRKPRGAALLLLNVISRRPDVVLQVLRCNRWKK
jgi:putative transcriptional regulator